MSADQFYNLGKDPVRIEAAPAIEDKTRYPCLYDIGVREFPPLKDMKLGDTGEAIIRFKIQGSGIEIHEIKSVGVADVNTENRKIDRKKLLKRHKTKDFAQNMSSEEVANANGGY